MKLRVLIAAKMLLLFAAVAADAQVRWVGTWAASQQLVEPHNSLSQDDLRDATLRQIVHVSIGGEEVRVRLSNRFGTAPLHFTSVHVARPISSSSSRISEQTDKTLTFAGRQDATISAGADFVSDPVAFPVAARSDVAITLHIDKPPSEQTGHPGSRATSYLAHGNLVSAPDLLNAKSVDHWYFIAGVDVAAPLQAAAIVVLGDSITDGRGSTTNANNRWPDLLAERLQASPDTQTLGVLNHGIGGNRLLLDGLGPNALARFDHDVLSQAGVRYLMILEGVNDIGMLAHLGEAPRAEHDALVQGILAAYGQVITRARTHGIKVIGCTILPFVGSAFYNPGPATEADRQAINNWIRTPGHFDAVVDFDEIMRDPEHPSQLVAAFDSGDHLHPSPAGYAAMAKSVPLSLFTPSAQPARVALTFDDLPAHGSLPPGVTRMDVASKIIDALRDVQAPPAYGFVNGAGVNAQPQDASVLQAWRSAGHLLANHTWSHMNLNQHSLTEFEAEITSNEALLTSLMKDSDWHWLRFPYLAVGDTPAKRAEIRSFLAQRGYKVAGVTMSFGDYQWTEPYARCKAKGDSQAIALLESSYLTAADESISYYRALSQKLYGRDVPYVLLLHVGAFSAEMLPRLLELYKSRGFTFVPLAEAESDTFYSNDTKLELAPGPDTLEGEMAARGMSLPTHRAPAVQFDTICRPVDGTSSH